MVWPFWSAIYCFENIHISMPIPYFIADNGANRHFLVWPKFVTVFVFFINSYQSISFRFLLLFYLLHVCALCFKWLNYYYWDFYLFNQEKCHFFIHKSDITWLQHNKLQSLWYLTTTVSAAVKYSSILATACTACSMNQAINADPSFWSLQQRDYDVVILPLPQHLPLKVNQPLLPRS